MDTTKRDLREIKLELLRPGPTHNQLLSPLTPYVALCGEDGPFTVNVPFEHARLLTRLERLCYAIDGNEVARSQREAELRELGEDIGAMLGAIPSFLTALCSCSEHLNSFIHLRLSLSGSELGLIPFETAIAPAGVAGFGAPLFIRAIPPITITREIRRVQPLPMQWNRPPRILFAFASPEGYAPVPAVDHLDALRRAIEPWVRLDDDPEQRLAAAKEILTVLPDATLNDIRKQCAATEFTHVHILAHGVPTRRGGYERFGLAFKAEDGGGEADIVLGEDLAIVLMGQNSTGVGKRGPTLVTLATCDSGAQGSVLVPGGSIAHELHTAGIPWVVASQFPLWMRASSISVDVLYSRMLEGNDPRRVLHELRQRLHTDARDTHDWASIVTYASLPESLDVQVNAFRTRQAKAHIEVRFRRVDDLASKIVDAKSSTASAKDEHAEIRVRFAEIRAAMEKWRKEPGAESSARELAERLGMAGSSEKRMAIVLGLLDDEASQKQSLQAYRLSLDYYRQALEAEPTNHWVMTRLLALRVTPRIAPTRENLLQAVAKNAALWVAAQQITKLQLRNATGTDRAWAYGTLLELDLLGAVFEDDKEPATSRIERLKETCAALTNAIERGNRFPIDSTRRQFQRYLDQWQRPEWNDLAAAIVNALSADNA